MRRVRGVEQAEYVRTLNREISAFRRNCQPRHAQCMEYASEEWFKACDKAFVQAMREHYPEREIKVFG